MPTGEAPISETATTPPEAGKGGPAKAAAKSVPNTACAGGFRPVVFIRGLVKNAPWVVIAVVLHVIVIAALSIIYVTTHKKDDAAPPTAISLGKNQPDEKDNEPDAPTPLLDRNAIPKAQNADAELIGADDIPADAPSVTAPTDDSSASDPGNPDAAPGDASGGTSLGVGGGPGHFGTGKPSAFVSRKAGTGGGGPPRSGSTVQTQKAVAAGLIWLVRHQQPDGSWAADKLGEVCDKDHKCGGDTKGAEVSPMYNEGITGLSLLAFLGYGADHTNKNKVTDNRGVKSRLGEVVKKGLEYLVKRQDAHADGRFSDDGHIYNEALATLAMCEAYGMTHAPKWQKSAQRGVDFLIKAQRLNPSGTGLWGWRYEPRSWFDSLEARAAIPDEKEWKTKQHEADISATAWVVMALKSAELAELEVPEATMQGAMAFVKYVTVDKGRVAYMDPLQVGRKLSGEGDEYEFHASTLAALGMCVRTFVEKNIDDPVLELSAKQLVADQPSVAPKESKDPKDRLGVDYYYWYYGTLALNQWDGPDSPHRNGKYWKEWNKTLTDTLIPLQDGMKSKESDPKTCGDGGWSTPDRWSHAGGPIYRAAINVLTLEVYYRYENAFGAAALKKHEDKPDIKGDKSEKQPK